MSGIINQTGARSGVIGTITSTSTLPLIHAIERGTFVTDSTITDIVSSNFQGFGMGLQWARNANATTMIINTNQLVDRLGVTVGTDSYRLVPFNLYLRTDSSALSVISLGTDVSGGSMVLPDVDTGIRFYDNVENEMGDQLWQNFQYIITSASEDYYAIDLIGKAHTKQRYAVILESSITVLQTT